jgi:hypothetical protein
MYPREVPYIMINYVTIPNFIFFILPLWGIIGAFWFFVFKKLYTEIKKKKYIKIFFYFAVVLIFVRLFCFVFWLLLLTMSYDTELKLINFTLEYSLEVRR